MKFFPQRGGDWSTFELTEELMSRSPKTKRPFQRICELMRRHRAKSVAICHGINSKKWFAGFTEHHKHIENYISEVQPFARVLDIAQVSFLSIPIGSINRTTFPKGIRSKSILGMCIVVTLQSNGDKGVLAIGEICSFVYEAITKLPNSDSIKDCDCLLEDYYHIISSEMNICINGRLFNIPQLYSYFCQSDGVTSVCAQASLRMALHHSDNPAHRSVSYGEMNNIVGHRKSETRTSSGYYTEEIIDILQDKEIDPLWLNCKEVHET